MNPKSPKESSSSIPSTYQVQPSGDVFTFTTDNDIVYIIAFQVNRDEFPNDPFREDCVTIELVRRTKRTMDGGNFIYDNKKLDPDPKIETTVCKLIYDLFISNPLLIINYTCDLSDNLERHRRIIFGKWYKDHFEAAGIQRISYENPSQRVYATALYQEGNPHRADIERVFSDLFQGK